MDPRDFIMGPNRTCARCGQEALGTISVGRLHVHRCRNCLSQVETELPRLRKAVVYIDQFAISNMMKALNPGAKSHESAASHPLWLRLFDRLDRLRQLQLIVCPTSDEHDRESSFSPEHRAMRRVYEHLSSGRSFLACERIRLQQVLTAITAWAAGETPTFVFDAQSVAKDLLHEWTDRLRIDVDMPFPKELVEGMRREREAHHSTMSDHFHAVKAAEPRTFKEWLDNERQGFPRGVGRAFVEWSRRQVDILEGRREWALNDAMPPEAVDWMELAIRACAGQDDRGKARTRANEFFASPTFADIPFVTLTCLVNAVVCMRATVGGQKVAPNRGMDADLRIVSTLLPYCDAMFVDNGFRSMLEDIPKPHRPPYPTRVFSTNVADEFLAYLEHIEASAAADHVARVIDVYGESWVRPRRRLFERDGES
jgi:hypothetical protein